MLRNCQFAIMLRTYCEGQLVVMETGLNFGSVYNKYRNFRPGYPKILFKKIIESVPCNMRNVAMDLGAGTGLSTIPLCRWFGKIIAVEPDNRMSRCISKRNKRIIVFNSKAEEHVQESSSIELITCGNALYWMDGPRVILNAALWLRSKGI